MRVAALKEPDRDAEFVLLLEQAHQELFGFIFAMLQNRADAEDVYQQCAMVMWEKFSTFTPGTNFLAWAFRIAQYKAKDFARARQRRKKYFTDATLDAIAAAYQNEPRERLEERLETLAQCMEKLRDHDRRLLEQCYSVDRDYRKIALAEGKTIAAIYKAVSRIRRSLSLCVQRATKAE
jgi:RNA polymerase sigma-70 factor (ECF subfamily)